MKEENRNSIIVLIFSRDLAWFGGVVNFTLLLMKKINPRVKFDHLQIGRRREHRGALRPLVQPLLDAVELYRRLRTRHYDVIHMNPSINRASVLRDSLFMLILRAFNTRNLLIFIRGWEDDYFDRLRGSFFGRNFVFRLFKQASMILVLGNKFRRELLDVGFSPDRIAVISTMFDGDALSSVSRVRREETVQLLFLSRIIAAKGIFELLEAVRQCVANGLDLSLVIAGDGEDRAAAEKWVAGNNLEAVVTFPGYLRGRDKAQALVDADLFVMPSYTEGCPNVLLEAMGAGLPVIATSVGGIPDVAEHGINGILLDDVSVGAIRSALELLVPNRERRMAISKANREHAWSNYEARAVCARIEGIYEQIAGAR